MEILFESIPEELRKFPNWVCWVRDERNGKPTKIPVNPLTRGNAKSNDPETWASFEEAKQSYLDCENESIAGIGFMFSNSDLWGMDLDHCRNAETGEIQPWAQEIILKANTYAELSPSETGVHLIGKGKLPPGARKKGPVEVYDSGRFFTITGQHVEGTPLTILDCQDRIETLHHSIFGKTGTERNGDEELMRKASAAENGQRFTKLWSGDWSNYPSQSEADLALCSTLAFWTNNNPDRIDRLFRQSGLMRSKWDEKHYGDGRTYGQVTIGKAIAETKEGYTPIAQGSPNKEKKPTITVGIHLTDWGNAQRLVAQHGSLFRYCYDWNKFLVWDGRRWVIDAVGEIQRLAKATITSIYLEASQETDKDRRQALAHHASRCESEGKIQAMIELAKSEPGVAIRPEELDLDPWLLNVDNGTLDLKTGILRKPSREDLITKLAPVYYDPTVECPLWTEHLKKIMVGKSNLINFLQRVFGYCLTGITGERVIFIAYGKGANGKSTTQETISSILGEDFSTRTTTETILLKREGTIPNDLAKLRGMRFVYASEAEQGRKLAESLIKDLTGGDKIAARFMRAEWFDFRPTFKVWLSTNHKPTIQGTDNAIWDRIRLIPFIVTIPLDERIPHEEMFARFQPERPGILAWMVRGCLEWQKERLGFPEEVREATAEYRAEMDLIGDFIEERCEVSKDAEVTSQELYQAYLSWCQQSGEKPISRIGFGKTLDERGFVAGKTTKGQRSRKGVALIHDEI